MYKVWVFLKRRVVTFASYRMALVMSFLGVLLSSLQFYFMSRMLGDGLYIPSLSPYGGDLMSYLIIGSSFLGLVNVGLTSFSGAIRNEQLTGTLEFLLMSETPLWQILAYSAVADFLGAAVGTVVVFAAMALCIGMEVHANLGAAGVVLLLAVISMSGIGLMSAGMIMVTKQGDPVSWVFGVLSGFMSGAVFPVELLPSALRYLSRLLPSSHALSALRKAITANASLSEVSGDVASLALLALVYVPLGILALSQGFNIARSRGGLAEY